MKHFKRLLALVLSLLLCLSASACASDAPSVSALFLNVGKADAALFFLGDQTYLIDTGWKTSYETLASALSRYGVTRLDGVVITHGDKDHYGGLKPLLQSGFPVDRLYASPMTTEASPEASVAYKRSQKYGVPLTWLSAGDELRVDDSTWFEVLGPLTRDDTNENNNSLVLLLHTAEGDMLLTGDMEREEELALLAAGKLTQAAVLKVGHHGDDDATSQALVSAVRPKLAIISTSTVEEKDTPDPSVVKRLWNIGATVQVTQQAPLGLLVTLAGGEASCEKIQ